MKRTRYILYFLNILLVGIPTIDSLPSIREALAGGLPNDWRVMQ